MAKTEGDASGLKAIAADVQTQLQAETAVVAVVEGRGKLIHYVAAVGKHADAIVGKRSPTKTSGLCGAAIASGQPELVCQVHNDVRVRQDIAEALGITTALAVPLEENGQLWGALMVLNRVDGRAFDEADQAKLSDYASTL